MIPLAIKGKEYSEEIIEILEMLGGRNANEYNGYSNLLYYYIDKNGIIDCSRDREIPFPYIRFTLEEFLAKYPYKVGDKVQHKGATSCGTVYVIERMKWTNNHIEYEIRPLYDYNHTGLVTICVEDLQPYKEETMEDKPNLLQQLKEYFENTPREVVEKEWHEYDKYNDISPKVNEYLEYVNNIRQPKFPKTYEACWYLLKHNPTFDNIKGYKSEIFSAFQKLLICRDAYWKIAGGWKPDWTNTNSNKHCIYYVGDEIKKQPMLEVHHFLAFPTSEMRDAFYENFKDLIEQCKELL